MMNKLMVMGVVVLMSGCAIAPNSLLVEGDHTSHFLQHCDGSAGNSGYSDVGMYARWKGKNWYLDVGEKYTIQGQLDGRHEVFNARAGYEIPLRKP